MTRDNTLIQDPNSLFAVSRALRKQIVRTDPNSQNRNDAIRDEKHIAYKSAGKGTIETFKYDILTSLEQLDNMFLELETVVPKITSDPAGTVGRPKGAKNKKARTGAGYSGGKRCCFNSSYCNGTAHYRNPRMTGGVLPDLPENSSIMVNLKSALSSVGGASRTLKKLLRVFLPKVEDLLGQYRMGEITNEDVIDGMDTAFGELDQRDVDKLNEIDGEEGGMLKIYNALQTWILTLPENAPEALAEPEETAPKAKRPNSLAVATGNEFVVSTLSKINVLLIKLIAEYNGKILPNYKKFLQSDLEEIADKVGDSQKRFRELKDDYLERFSEGAKAANIDKFVSVIDKNFNRFTALVSRSIANFVNPNLIHLPNFSTQLIEGFVEETQPDKTIRRPIRRTQERTSSTIQDPKQPFNVYQEALTKTEREKQTEFDTRVDKLVAEYNKIEETFLDERDSKFQPAREKLLHYEASMAKYETKLKKDGLTEEQKINYGVLQKKYATKNAEMKRSASRLDKYVAKMDRIKIMPEFAFFPRVV